MQTIKFNRHNVRNTTTGAKCRVRYSLDNRVDGRKCVTLYAKGYADEMFPVFGSVENDSDMMTDYSTKDTYRIFEDNPLYQAARSFVESL